MSPIACEKRAVLTACMLALMMSVAIADRGVADETLPFSHKVEVYRNEEQGVTVFALRLEQPFLAEEFESSSYLRVEASDDKAHLIYPKEGRFQQKQAEFYGRLRGEGRTKLRSPTKRCARTSTARGRSRSIAARSKSPSRQMTREPPSSMRPG